MRPSEIVVLYVEVLFALSTCIVEYDYVRLCLFPVVGNDALICVDNSEHVSL